MINKIITPNNNIEQDFSNSGKITKIVLINKRAGGAY